MVWLLISGVVIAVWLYAIVRIGTQTDAMWEDRG